MIAVDTNVLLRYLLRDDEAQADRARRLFRRAGNILVTDVVLVEAVWTLMGRRYRATKSDLIAAIETLLGDPRIRFERDDVIWRALQSYRQLQVDFADALIVHKALNLGTSKEPIEEIYTFDSAALELPQTVQP